MENIVSDKTVIENEAINHEIQASQVQIDEAELDASLEESKSLSSDEKNENEANII